MWKDFLLLKLQRLWTFELILSVLNGWRFITRNQLSSLGWSSRSGIAGQKACGFPGFDPGCQTALLKGFNLFADTGPAWSASFFTLLSMDFDNQFHLCQLDEKVHIPLLFLFAFLELSVSECLFICIPLICIFFPVCSFYPFYWWDIWVLIDLHKVFRIL